MTHLFTHWNIFSALQHTTTSGFSFPTQFDHGSIFYLFKEFIYFAILIGSRCYNACFVFDETSTENHEGIYARSQKDSVGEPAIKQWI